MTKEKTETERLNVNSLNEETHESKTCPQEKIKTKTSKSIQNNSYNNAEFSSEEFKLAQKEDATFANLCKQATKNKTNDKDKGPYFHNISTMAS